VKVPTTHGGPDEHGVPLHDFSTNANTVGPCPGALAAVRDADPAHYPDPQSTALRQAIARFHDVASWRVVIAASASEFIARITAAMAYEGARRVWVPRHAYGDYGRAARAWGLEVDTEPASPEGTQLMWLCEPSNPLGQAQPGLGTLIDTYAGSQVAVLDLSYELLRLEGRFPLNGAQLARVWQLWTPGKALGLPGVRAGYAIAPVDAQPLVDRLEELSASWPLGVHGVALLQHWIGDEAQRWLAGSLTTLREWKASQVAMCEGMGWRVRPSETNFFCAHPGLDDLRFLHVALRNAGIKLRDAADFDLPGWVRLAVRPPASQRELARVWLRPSRSRQA
jgi:histidinol-phosphate aminotransferase